MTYNTQEPQSLIVFDLSVGSKIGAIDELLLNNIPDFVEKSDISRWWFNRYHQENGAVLQLFLRKDSPEFTSHEMARKLHHLDLMTLKATSRGTSDIICYASKYLSDVYKVSEADVVVGARLGNDKLSARVIDTHPFRHVFEEILDLLCNFCLKVISLELSGAYGLRKDAAPGLMDTLFNALIIDEQRKEVLNSVYEEWINYVHLSDIVRRQIEDNAKNKILDGSLSLSNGRFSEKHKNVAIMYKNTISKIKTILSNNPELLDEQYQLFTIQFVCESLFNSLGFQRIDLWYLCSILLKKMDQDNE